VQSIRWIELLDAVQAFKQPPKVIHLDNSVIFPFWTKSAALARIAKNEPSAVAKVVSRMPRTTNPRVNDHLMNVASLVPTIADVQRVLPHAIHYAKQRYYLSASAFSDVIQRWVSVGAIEAHDSCCVTFRVNPNPEFLFGNSSKFSTAPLPDSAKLNRKN
jgi:hypothetical protein